MYFNIIFNRKMYGNTSTYFINLVSYQFISAYVCTVLIDNIKTSGVTESEPVWGPVLLMLFVAVNLFLLLNVVIVMMFFAYHDSKAAIANKAHSSELDIISILFYKLLHWMNRLRNVNYDTMGNEASQFTSFESKMLFFVLPLNSLLALMINSLLNYLIVYLH